MKFPSISMILDEDRASLVGNWHPAENMFNMGGF